MQQEWYFKINNNIEVGPLDNESFSSYIQEGRVTPDTPVKKGDNKQWTPAKMIDGLFTDQKAQDTPSHIYINNSSITDTGSLPFTVSREMQGKQQICPHCWSKFPIENIMYISRHPDLIGDPVIAGAQEQQRFLPTRFTPEGHAIDARGIACPDMACPYCHLLIPQTIIDLDSIFFSIIGAPASGKSYFLTTMIWALRNKLSSLFNFAFTDADPQANAIINGYEQQLFLNSHPEKITIIQKTQVHGDLYNHVILNDMDISLPMPFIFKLQPFDDDIDEETYTKNMILYDNAGEHFQPGREEVSQPATKHLVHSNGLIFLFDPSIDAKMRKECNKNDPQLEALSSKVTNQETLLSEMIRRIRLYSGMKTTDKYEDPLIITVSKYDLWKTLFPIDLENIEPWVLSDDLSYKFDLSTLLNVSYHMRNIMLKMAPSLVKTAESFSNKVFFVPSSSFGCFPEIDETTGGLGIRPDTIHSIWCEVPVLLLLATHGYIPIYRRESSGKPVTNYKQKKKDSITFTIPGSTQRVQLPAVYLGETLYHIESDSWFTLPGHFELRKNNENRDDDAFFNSQTVIKKAPEKKIQVFDDSKKKNTKSPLLPEPTTLVTDKVTPEPKTEKTNQNTIIPGLKADMKCGDFKLIEKIGNGSMGEVWRAHQESMNRNVALKILSPELASDTIFVKRFLKEVNTSAKLSHPNIVTAFYSGVDKGLHYLALAYVEGRTIDEIIKNDGVYKEKNALNIIKTIATALNYAWTEAKILHRDIKPANIIIDKKGKPMILDMGISKSLDEDASLTMTGMIIGTPYYISPEQAMSEKNIDFRSDIYSLGVTLYHMVTGSVPYTGTTAMRIMMKHVKGVFPPPRERNPNLSEECSLLLEIMMAKEKDDRPDSWQTLVQAIDLVISGKTPVIDK